MAGYLFHIRPGAFHAHEAGRAGYQNSQALDPRKDSGQNLA
jgi:hypothetical protein